MKEKLLVFCLFISIFLLYPVLAENTDSEIHFTDALGREIIFDKPVERIGFADHNIAEALKLIGAWDKVVAREGYISDSNIYPNLDSIPAISDSGGYEQLDYEKIFEIRPDVMILRTNIAGSIMDSEQEIIDKLEPEIPVVFLDTRNIETFDTNIKHLGMITGNEERAQEIVNFYNDLINEIKEKTSSLSDNKKPNVFVKASGMTRDELCTEGEGHTLWNQLNTIAGGKSISSELEPYWISLDPEWLLDKDIDIIVADCWDVLYPEPFGYQASDPENKKQYADQIISEIADIDVLCHTEAVKNNQIYLIHDPLIGSTRFIVGLAYLAKWYHPELFQELDPEEIHEKYLDFLDVDYNLDAVGYAGYPLSTN